MEERAILLKGNFSNLEEILIHARTVGKKLLGVDRVTVNPEVCRHRQGYLVIVKPEKNGHVEREKNGKTSKTNP